MGRVIDIDALQGVVEVQKAQQQCTFEDLENYRKLGILQVFGYQGTDEECEQSWLESLNVTVGADDGLSLYVSEPGKDR